MSMFKCSDCKMTKPGEEFNSDKSRGKRGLSYKCRSCAHTRKTTPEAVQKCKELLGREWIYD